MLSLVTDNFDRPGGNVYSEGFYPAARAGKVRSDPDYEATAFGDVRLVRGALPGNLMADIPGRSQSDVKALKRPGHETNPLYMHPDDARAHNLAHGSRLCSI